MMDGFLNVSGHGLIAKAFLILNSQFLITDPPVILGNSFINNAIGVKVVQNPDNLANGQVAPTLYISCNTFTQTTGNNRVYTTDAYGIYADQGAWFLIDRLAPFNNATMKNQFNLTNPPGGGLFKHLYNASGNNVLNYKTFHANSGNQGTNAGNIIEEEFLNNRGYIE